MKKTLLIIAYKDQLFKHEIRESAIDVIHNITLVSQGDSKLVTVTNVNGGWFVFDPVKTTYISVLEDQEGEE